MSLLHNSIIIITCTVSILHAFTTAKEYFDAGAQTYILKNDVKNAKLILQEGIAAFPDDEQLKKLAEKIKEEENKQDQNNQNKNDQNQNKQDQKDQQQQQDNKEDQNKQDQNKDQQQKQDEQKPDQQSQPDQKNQKDQQQQQMQQSEMKEQQDLKKEEARRIIEMYADDADTLNKPMTKQKAAGARQPLQDW